jgi:acetyl esterase
MQPHAEAHRSSIGEMPAPGPLHPQARALLDVFARHNSPPPPADPAEAVAALRAGYHGLDGLAGRPEPVTRVDDQSVGGADGMLAARLYRPEGSRGGPLLVWFHGGGFISGDLDTHDRPLRAVANRARSAVLSVAYRLAPEHPYPAAIEDAHAVLSWAYAHAAAAYGADPSRIVVGGDSAGGNIAAVATMLARDRGGPPLASQILIYPDADARPGYTTDSWRTYDGILLDRANKDRGLSLYLPAGIDRTHPHVSPALAAAADLRGLPPAYIVTAEHDPLRDEAENYASRLREVGVPVRLDRFPGMIHGFFQMAAKLDAGRDVIARVAADLRGR